MRFLVRALPHPPRFVSAWLCRFSAGTLSRTVHSMNSLALSKRGWPVERRKCLSRSIHINLTRTHLKKTLHLCTQHVLVSPLLSQGTLPTLLDCYGITYHCVRLWCHVLSCFVPTCLLQLPGFSRHRLPHLGPVRRRVEAKLINWPFSPLRADWGQQISVC